MFSAFLIPSLAALLAFGCGKEANGQTSSLAFTPGNGGIELAPGFRAVVVAELGRTVRHIVARSNGDLYARLRGGGIAALRDSNGDGRADEKRIFADERAGGTGIGLYKNHLYYSTDTAVYRRAFADSGELVPSGQEQLIVGGFPQQGQHAAKSFALDGRGGLYVNVGGPSNACQKRTRSAGSPGQDPCPELRKHGGVWRFSAERLGQSFTPEARYASGVRNAVAIDWDARTDALYVVQHGRDQLDTLWPQQFTARQNANLPAEEFLKLDAGADAGWPYCYYDPDQNKKVLAPEYGGDGKRVGRCERFTAPIVAFPAHWAPNGLLFYNPTAQQFPPNFRGGAFIAWHGSWNRAPFEMTGYRVSFVPFRDGAPVGRNEWKEFAWGFPGKESIRSPSEAKFRPMGLALAPDGTLYISDSRQGRIWRVAHVR